MCTDGGQTHIHTDKQAGRQAGGDRETDTETDRQTDRHTIDFIFSLFI